MTTITIVEACGQVRQVTVAGHAGFAEKGEDIVCAAISILTTTCVNALEAVAGVVPKVQQEAEGARIAFSLPEGLPAHAMHDAQVVIRTALQGFEDLSSEYPEYITIIDGRKKTC